MKATGIQRRVDELGRIVLPVELRRALEIEDRDLMEIYMDEHSCIVLKPHRDSCIFCGGMKVIGLTDYLVEVMKNSQALAQVVVRLLT